QVQGGIRVIKGLEGVLADTASLAMATRGTALVAGRLTRQEIKTSPLQQQQQQSTKSKGKVTGAESGSGSGGSRQRRSSLCSISSTRSQEATTSESCSGGEDGLSHGVVGTGGNVKGTAARGAIGGAPGLVGAGVGAAA
ncbi:unnamed protein product, partial [Sphacelaria rigidula]